MIKDLEVLPLALAPSWPAGHRRGRSCPGHRGPPPPPRPGRAAGARDDPAAARLVVATQASLLAVIGLVFGVPLG